MTGSGTPRALIEDDTYGGFVFEKGTTFSYNHFAISHNEKEFPRNEVFLPERFLNDDLQDMLKGHLGFGAGELAGRQCISQTDDNRETRLSWMASGDTKHVCCFQPVTVLLRLLGSAWEANQRLGDRPLGA